MENRDGIYKTIVESFPMSVLIMNRTGYITYVNPAITKITGYSKEEIIGKHFTKLGFLNQIDVTQLVNLFKTVITGKTIDPFEVLYTSKEGKQGWGRGKVSLLREEGNITGLQIITEEITKQKQLEEQLKQSEEKYQILGEATQEGWIEIDIDGTILSVNSIGANILGYKSEELIGTKITKYYVHPEERKKLVESLLGYNYVVDYRIEGLKKNGEHIYLSINGTLYTDKINGSRHFITTYRDVTEQTKYLQRLEALLKHAATLSRAESMDDVAEITEETITKTIGFDRGSIGIVEGKTLNHMYRWGVSTDTEFILPLDGPGITVKAVNTGETQLIGDVENNPLYVDGVGPIVTRSELTVPILIGEKVIAVINIENERKDAFTEIDQKLVEIYAEQVSSTLQRIQAKKTEQQLLERYIGFSNAATESFVLIDKDLNIIEMNQVGIDRYGLEVGEIIGKNLLKIQPSLRDSPRYYAYLKILETGISETFDVYDHPSGIEYLRVHAFKVGEGLGLIASDLSELKREQEEKVKLNQELFEQKVISEQLVEMDRMKTNFMNSATHEIRTPITSIKGYSELIELLVFDREDPELRKYLDAILRNVDRLEHLSNDLLDIQRIESNRMVINKTQVKINELMNSITQEMNPLLMDRRQTLEINNESDEETIMCDEMRIIQVLINLVNNASYYSPANTEIKVTIGKQGKDHIFTIKDQGEGLTEEDLPKLFKPFPDIKARIQRGTGLGLSICRGIIELHGGKIWAESEGIGKGSTFYFTIPVS